MEKHNTFKALDAAIDSHIKDVYAEDGTFITGWVLVASVSSPDHDASASDGYISFSSEGMPHHAGIGLLNMALEEKRSLGFVQTIMSMFQQFNQEEGEE